MPIPSSSVDKYEKGLIIHDITSKIIIRCRPQLKLNTIAEVSKIDVIFDRLSPHQSFRCIQTSACITFQHTLNLLTAIGLARDLSIFNCSSSCLILRSLFFIWFFSLSSSFFISSICSLFRSLSIVSVSISCCDVSQFMVAGIVSMIWKQNISSGSIISMTCISPSLLAKIKQRSMIKIKT